MLGGELGRGSRGVGREGGGCEGRGIAGAAAGGLRAGAVSWEGGSGGGVLVICGGLECSGVGVRVAKARGWLCGWVEGGAGVRSSSGVFGGGCCGAGSALEWGVGCVVRVAGVGSAPRLIAGEMEREATTGVVRVARRPLGWAVRLGVELRLMEMASSVSKAEMLRGGVSVGGDGSLGSREGGGVGSE